MSHDSPVRSKKKTFLSLALKGGITVAAFWALLTNSVEVDGERVQILDAIIAQLGTLEAEQFIPWILLATGIKAIGILSSMFRWHLMLRGQGIRFNFGHIVGSFLIGRFLGTFLPSTVGLDGYKLYDAAKFSGDAAAPAAATAVEKVIGLSGVFLTFLVALPFGAYLFGDAAATVALVTVPLACTVIAGLFTALFKPGLILAVVRWLPSFGRGRIENFVRRAGEAAAAYKGRSDILAGAMGLSFVVHFTTAVMYFFTALAIGAVGAEFWQITLASSIQIFATVISPFTIAGEGVREIVQALLLAKHIGAAESILSAALGFWAAEALTLVGAFFLWGRKRDYKPRVVELTNAQSEEAPSGGGSGSAPTAERVVEAAPQRATG